jgi:hypothetical protein
LSANWWNCFNYIVFRLKQCLMIQVEKSQWFFYHILVPILSITETVVGRTFKTFLFVKIGCSFKRKIFIF